MVDGHVTAFNEYFNQHVPYLWMCTLQSDRKTSYKDGKSFSQDRASILSQSKQKDKHPLRSSS